MLQPGFLRGPQHRAPAVRQHGAGVAVDGVRAAPADANVYGDVFGGWIMAQVDIAGSLPATRRANGRVATIAVNSFVFKNPVFVGDLLSFYADIVRVGTTSITVNVEVYAERNRLQADIVKVTEATLTYVATGSDRKPRPVPPIESLMHK
jgi:acyl-CoA thioesterase YciA